MNIKSVFSPGLQLLALAFSLTACATTRVSPMRSQATVDIPSSFQSQLSPIPPLPPYMCGAWTSNNGPAMYGIITIYARLTHDVSGVANVPAVAIAHFTYGDFPLEQHLESDQGGYVAFTLSLAGRQASGRPATVDVTFNVPGEKVRCSAFFTPQ